MAARRQGQEGGDHHGGCCSVTGAYGFLLGRPGVPWPSRTFLGYAIGIFLLQWFIDQKAIKKICKVLGLFGKAKLKEYGVTENDLGVLDE
jgi:hypothetical protein